MKTLTELDQNACQKIGQGLAQILADTYILYTKTQNFHWNVVDERFHSLHEMFEEQYKQLAEMVDELAERLRMLRLKSPGGLRQFLEIGTLQDAQQDLPGNEMIRELMHDHEALAAHIRPKIEEAVKMGDEGTGDLLIQQLRIHEKMAWMLRSHLIEESA